MQQEWQLATEIPGTRRPGGRTERTRVAVMHATLDLLAEHGFAQLTVEAVAERAGVHKTTVYRRWTSAEDLVAAAMRFGAEVEAWTAPDTGSLEGDLRLVVRELVHYFTSPGLRELPMASVAAAFVSSRTAEAIRDFYLDRHARSAVMTERAITRGEVPAGTDPDEVVRAACGPIFYRLFLSREPATFADADLAVRAAVTAAAAGVFVRQT